eukprot:264750-Chlamydomonas_euryale.AAC.10
MAMCSYEKSIPFNAAKGASFDELFQAMQSTLRLASRCLAYNTKQPCMPGGMGRTCGGKQ